MNQKPIVCSASRTWIGKQVGVWLHCTLDGVLDVKAEEKQALLAAKSVAYIDPASGGSSGIYIDKLLERLGIADQVTGFDWREM